MSNNTQVGEGAPVMNLSDYLDQYPKSIVLTADGKQIKKQGNGGGYTVGNRPIGTGIDGQLLEVPKFIPAIANLEKPNEIAEPNIPYTTLLTANSNITFTFTIRSNPYGPMRVQGFYILAFNSDGEIVDLSEGNGGHTIEAAIKITGEHIWQGHQEIYRDDYYVFPLPVEAGAGANIELTLTRFNIATNLPDNLYVAWGVYGVQRHFIPPSFHIDSSLAPIRNQTTGFRVRVLDSQIQAGPPPIPSTTSIDVRFDNRHPTIVDEMWFGGDESTFFDMSWEAGELSPRPIPTALFRYRRQGGQLPSPLLINAPMSLKFNLYNWQDEETTVTQALNIGSASFGY